MVHLATTNPGMSHYHPGLGYQGTGDMKSVVKSKKVKAKENLEMAGPLWTLNLTHVSQDEKTLDAVLNLAVSQVSLYWFPEALFDIGHSNSFPRNPNLTGISNDPMRAHALVTHGSIEILVLYDS
ncbi:hypothetical protein E5288_WYG019391 [Bos mutus]|uniref:Uncharacterized protein n=1 Tax=Bos mutus TaxID=72004 RepID=A0A6B0RDU0_9CETA|nr:hypothetical protein [Bos mutus]